MLKCFPSLFVHFVSCTPSCSGTLGEVYGLKMYQWQAILVITTDTERNDSCLDSSVLCVSASFLSASVLWWRGICTPNWVVLITTDHNWPGFSMQRTAMYLLESTTIIVTGPAHLSLWATTRFFSYKKRANPLSVFAMRARRSAMSVSVAAGDFNLDCKPQRTNRRTSGNRFPARSHSVRTEVQGTTWGWKSRLSDTTAKDKHFVWGFVCFLPAARWAELQQEPAGSPSQASGGDTLQRSPSSRTATTAPPSPDCQVTASLKEQAMNHHLCYLLLINAKNIKSNR